MQLTRARIAQIAEKLKKMPPAPLEDRDVTKQEAVKLLSREITGLQRKGYSLEQIVSSLKGEGIDLTTPTLKSYLSRSKAARVRRQNAPSPARMSEGVATPLTTKAAPPSTKTDAPAKTGKDAFLVKDKVSY
jgi:hypothetical protein